MPNAASERVWDLVDHLVHPAAIYVIAEIGILVHLGDARPLRELHPVQPVSLGIYLGQFLGAWAVFYTTLLRDMGYRCAAGTILLIAAALGATSQFWIFPEPRQASGDAVAVFVGAQLALAVVAWPLVMVRWYRLKRQEGASG